MCFKQKQTKKINKVYPTPPPPTFTVDEIIECYFCKYDYNLSQIKIHCAGCDQFFHCNIAGKCIGNLCKNGNGHQLSWCKSCVPKTEFNLSNNNKCICYDCFTPT